MDIQNSLLINRFTPELFHYTLNYISLIDIQSFAHTCDAANKMISELWSKKGFSSLCAREGFLEKEVQYCLSTSNCIQINFAGLFDTATSQFPHLLSSKGLTFQNEGGNIVNIRCAFNSHTLALTFLVYSEDGTISVERLKPCLFIDNKETFEEIFDQPSLINSDSYAYRSNLVGLQFSDEMCMTVNKQKFKQLNILFSAVHKKVGIFELGKINLLQIEPPLMDDAQKKFDATHFNVQKLRETPPISNWIFSGITCMRYCMRNCTQPIFLKNYKK